MHMHPCPRYLIAKLTRGRFVNTWLLRKILRWGIVFTPVRSGKDMMLMPKVASPTPHSGRLPVLGLCQDRPLFPYQHHLEGANPGRILEE